MGGIDEDYDSPSVPTVKRTDENRPNGGENTQQTESEMSLREVCKATLPDGANLCLPKRRGMGLDYEKGQGRNILRRYQGERVPLREYEVGRNRLYQTLDGYHVTAEELSQTVYTFVDFMLHCPQLPIGELKQCYGIFETQMPKSFRERFMSGIERLEDALKDLSSLSSRSQLLSDGGPTEAQRSSPRSKDIPAVPTASDAKSRLHAIQERCSSPTSSPTSMCKDPFREFNEILKDTVQDLHFCLSREYGDDILSQEDLTLAQMRADLKIQMAPVESLLVKYFQGYVVAAVAEIRQLFLTYLEVEDIFHDSDIDVPGLVIHSKRPEYDPEQLLHFARSHRALKMKNRLVLGLLEAIKTSPELMDHTDQFDNCLRRLASFSKIDYSLLSHEARQLLLTRREKVSFSRRTHDLVESLWDVLETYYLPNAVSCPTSPVTFGGRLWNTYWLSPTPGSANPIGQSVGSHTGHNNTSNMAANMQNSAHISSNYIGLCALDFSKYPTDSLIAILGHHSPKLKKLAIHILVMRIFGIRAGKIHDFRVKAHGESWDTPKFSSSGVNSSHSMTGGLMGSSEKTPIAWTGIEGPGQNGLRTQGNRSCPKSPDNNNNNSGGENSAEGSSLEADNGNVIPGSASGRRKEVDPECLAGLQEVNPLIAVWTHDAVMSFDWLTSNCDPLRRDSQTHAAKGATQHSSSQGANEGSLTSRLDPSGTKNSASLASKYVTAGSRLHHMLNAFAGPSESDSQGMVGRSQQTTAFLIEDASEFETAFRACVEELEQLQPCLPPFPPAIDGRILLSVVLDLCNPSSYSDAGTPGHEEPNHATFAAVINQNQDALKNLNVNLIWIVFLGGTAGDSRGPTGRNGKGVLPKAKKHARKMKEANEVEDKREPPPATGSKRVHKLKAGSLEFLPRESPGLKCFYYRNISALPISTGKPCWSLIGNSTNAPLNIWRSENFVADLSKATGDGSAGDPQLNSTSSSPPISPFVEETLLRHCEIPFFQYLELKRLRNFHVTKHPTTASNVHLFEAVPKLYTQTNEQASPRFFVRIITNVNAPLSSEVGLFEQERCFVNGLNALELCLRDNTGALSAMKPVGNHHILMTVVYIPHLSLKRWCGGAQGGDRTGSIVSHAGNVRASPTASNFHASVSGAGGSSSDNSGVRDLDSMKLTPSAAEQIARGLWERYSKRIQKLGASVIEVRFKTRGWQSLGHLQGSPSLTEGVYPYRIVLDNPTGQTLRSRRFVEIQNPSTGERVFAALDSGDSLSTLILKSNSTTREDKNMAMGRNGQASQTPLLSNEAPNVNGKDSRESHDYDGKPVDTEHPWAGRLESKRVQAAQLQTLYVYDFIDLFEVAVRNMWRKCPKYLFGPGEDSSSARDSSSDGLLRSRSRTIGDEDSLPTLMQTATTLVPDRVVEAMELALNKNGDLVELARRPGQNECGMVAWRVLLRTPEFPQGRRIVLIANDVTYYNGTFGVQEDLLFQRASELARLQGIPRVYIAVNSGARMGLATEVQNAFKVEWIDSENPTKGFKYIYVTESDYKKLQLQDSIIAEHLPHPIEGKVWKILDIIGANIGLGVENLCGSGAIAGETARAYKTSMTITYVTGRTVGIGAYLARLGHRVIQKNTAAPILLTGFQALNRLIGRQVYTSNDEIGGVDVMHCNGVSHIVVRSDLEGCEAILEWLSFVPEHREGPLPVMIDPGDPISRRIEYKPNSSTNDPRLMLTGCVDQNSVWLGGLLDRGSFREVMTGWAKSVIVGRGRLGGIPVGIISVETRVTETLLPADPAMPLTSEVKLTRAGQVWFPDSAYKTVQAISDFNKEEIPLFIFANWRGFSGGQRDMFFEILKFGAMIVDALVDFRQPCFVYIPPKGELRGGAWVVVDPRINADFMEMFADPDSRGGVLEPSGTVEIKFRDKALREAAARSDGELKRLNLEDQQLADEGVPIDDPRRQLIKEKTDNRISDLMPVIKQVAVHFADLHDTPVRMKKKRAIVDVVSWEKSRQFFYWRLRRQLILFNLRNEAVKQNPKLTLSQAQKIIYHWASESEHSVENSQQFVHWACHSIQNLSRRLHALRSQYLKETVAEFCRESINAVGEGLKTIDQGSFERLLAMLMLDREKRQDGGYEGRPTLNRDSKVISDRQQAALERITMSARLMDR